jgi:hypothetical protein
VAAVVAAAWVWVWEEDHLAARRARVRLVWGAWGVWVGRHLGRQVSAAAAAAAAAGHRVVVVFLGVAAVVGHLPATWVGRHRKDRQAMRTAMAMAQGRDMAAALHRDMAAAHLEATWAALPRQVRPDQTKTRPDQTRPYQDHTRPDQTRSHHCP